MGSALKRGRTLKLEAVEQAKKWRKDRLDSLNAKIAKGNILSLSRKERREWRQLTGRLYPEEQPQ
jgi:hypothetical protein